jgi:FkbM family methyltransferase
LTELSFTPFFDWVQQELGECAMAIGRSSKAKSIAQSTIRAASFLFATQATEVLLTSAAAYLAALRGSTWSPTVEQEARCAVKCVSADHEFLVIDAGANVGSWLHSFWKQSSGKGRTYAFEPQPDAAAKIRQLNLLHCEVLQVALGEQPGKMTFFTSGDSDTMASLFERHDTYVRGRKYRELDVEVIRLDDFVLERKIDRIDFMKMDLEGGEFQALKGAAECMRSGILRALSFEFGISNVNSRVFFRDLYNLLTENHYEIFRVTPAGRLIPLKKYSEDDECFARTTTYLAKLR